MNKSSRSHTHTLRCFPQVALVAALLWSLHPSTEVRAEVRVPSIFGNHMVLQRNQANPVWGWADPGEIVSITLHDQSQQTTASQDGRWRLKLDPVPEGGPFVLTISGKNTLRFEDVLIGEVWVCSGQSNMQFSVQTSNDSDLEKLTADFPRIRLLTVPLVGSQDPLDDFEGQWQLASPQTVGNFSGVGYFFGRQLHQTLNVPIGLIDNAWGGSSAEAWVRRDLLESDARYEALMDRWRTTEKNEEHLAVLAKYQDELATWKQALQATVTPGQVIPPRPRIPGNPLTGQHRPGNLYNGILHPIIGYGIQGVIWYQGESNAGRAYQYRHLFPLMIQLWRDQWGQGDFPFYWVQLADFKDEQAEPASSDWAELREAQTRTLDELPHTGEAVIIDLGEAHDIHPKNKQDVANRLARLALANDYGYDIVHHSPRYKGMDRQGAKIVLSFNEVGGGLDTFDVRQPVGFSIAGVDQTFHWAEGKILDASHIEVWSADVPEPVVVRYAWADNPVCNVQNKEGLPLTPFRTDDWPGVTINNR